MEIIEILEQAKAQIKAEEQRKVELAKQQVMRDIAPKNQELEQIKLEEINKINVEYQNTRSALIEQHNKQLVALQDKFNVDKANVTQAIEQKKSEILNFALANATCEITSKSGEVIATLDNQIKELKE